jgi:hypothetical protein
LKIKLLYQPIRTMQKNEKAIYQYIINVSLNQENKRHENQKKTQKKTKLCKYFTSKLM